MKTQNLMKKVSMYSILSVAGMNATFASVPVACQDHDSSDLAYLGEGGAGAGNGGDVSEIVFKNILKTLSGFMNKRDGKKLFPEVKVSEFSKVVKNVNVFTTEKKVHDIFGNERTCAVSKETCIILCNREELSSLLKSRKYEDQISVFILGTHEVFRLIDVEQNGKVPSEYDLSNRLKSYKKIDELMNYSERRRPLNKGFKTLIKDLEATNSTLGSVSGSLNDNLNNLNEMKSSTEQYLFDLDKLSKEREQIKKNFDDHVNKNQKQIEESKQKILESEKKINELKKSLGGS